MLRQLRRISIGQENRRTRKRGSPAAISLLHIADQQSWSKKTYNNAISALRRAFEFGYRDHPERRDPAAALRSARIGKRDRPRIDPFSIQDAETLIAAIHRDWGEAQGNYNAFRFFTGLRPYEQIALVVTDFDAVQGVLSVTKARVLGIDKDVTKTAEDRRVMLCPRALVLLGQQLQLRARLVQEGAIDNAQLFFTAEGAPIRELAYPHARWQRTSRSLAIRYRKPYAARHSSVSWDLMIGRNPLFVPNNMATVSPPCCRSMRPGWRGRRKSTSGRFGRP